MKNFSATLLEGSVNDQKKDVRIHESLLNSGGKIVHAKETRNTLDEVNIDTREWSPGLYVVSVLLDGKLIESTKFSIIE